jgi:lipoprotein-anchoring transpeptidase ErfK/SrfK
MAGDWPAFFIRKSMKTGAHKKIHHWYSSFWADIVWVSLGVLALLFIFGTQYATGEFGYLAKLEKSADIKPTETAVVIFSQPVAAGAIEKNFSISPEAKVKFFWSDNYRRLEIKPDDYFSPGKIYTLKIDPRTAFSVSRMLGREADPVNLKFATEDPPEVVSMNPVSGDPNIKIDSAIKISFDKSTFGYDINFVIDPYYAYDLSYDQSRKDFTIMPRAKFEYSTDYAVSVRQAFYRENISDDKMPEIFRANFKTEPSPPPPKKIEEVVLPETDAFGEIYEAYVASIDAKIEEGKYIDINLKSQQLSIFEDGERMGTYQVSTGKRGMVTPTGTFKVMKKIGRAWSRKYQLYMPYWMQFTGAGHGIHELPEWKNGYKEGANHLGTPVSHGCVRLGVGPAAKVYDWTEVGTAVVIHY